MGISHDTLVAFAKSFGLFYLIAMSIGVAVYALWPGNRKKFTRAKTSILDNEDKPRTPHDEDEPGIPGDKDKPDTPHDEDKACR